MNPLRKHKFSIILGLIIIVAATGVLVLNRYQSMRQHLIMEFTTPVILTVENILRFNVINMNHRISAQKKKEISQLLNKLPQPQLKILEAQLLDIKQNIYYSLDANDEGRSLDFPGMQKDNSKDKLLIEEGQKIDGRQIIKIRQPFKGKNGEIQGYLLLVLGAETLASSMDSLLYLLIGVYAVMSLMLVLTIIILSRMYKQPLKHLDYAISKMDEDDFTYRVKYKKKDEFTDTFSKLNRTIEKVSYLKEDYKKAEKRIVSLLKAVNEGILVIDTKKNVTSFNDATYKLFKSTKDSFSAWFLKTLASNREINDLVTKVLKGEGQVKEKETTVFLPDESQILVKMSIQGLKEENVIQGAVFTFKDSRLINELENNLLRSMKFGVITNLASSISHEIKNPLSSMALHAEILEGNIKKMDVRQKTKILKSVETLQSESRRLNRIIQQFLTLARPSKLGLNLINLNKVINEVLELVQQQAQEQGISIVPDLDPSLGIVYGDEDQIKQVLLNIVLNAFASMPGGGTVDIISRLEYEKVFVQIKDTGVGIPDKIRNKVFDLYFSTKKDGGGVGLAVCQNIIRAHDGRIEFESVEGKGTVFTFQLPIKDPTTIRSTRIKPISNR